MPVLFGPHGAILTTHGAIIVPNAAATPTPAPTPTGTVPAPLLFTGTAGTLPPALGVTPFGSNPITGMGQDGKGALLLPSQTYGYCMFTALGTFSDAGLVIKAAGGPQPLSSTLANPGSADGGWVAERVVR